MNKENITFDDIVDTKIIQMKEILNFKTEIINIINKYVDENCFNANYSSVEISDKIANFLNWILNVLMDFK